MARKPANQTRAHNYLLRSRYSDSLIEIAVATRHAQITIGNGEFNLVKSDGRTIASQPSATIRQCLIAKGLARVTRQPGTFRTDGIMLTDAGRDALDGALAWLAGLPHGEMATLDESYYLARIEGRRGDGMPHVAPAYCREHGWRVGNIPCVRCAADIAQYRDINDAPVIEPAPAEPLPAVDSLVSIETEDIELGRLADSMFGVAAVVGRVLDAHHDDATIDVLDWPALSGTYPLRMLHAVPADVAAQIERDRAAREHVAPIIEPAPATTGPWVELGSIVEIEMSDIERERPAASKGMADAGVAAVLGRVVDATGATDVAVSVFNWPQVSGYYPRSMVRPASGPAAERYGSAFLQAETPMPDADVAAGLSVDCPFCKRPVGAPCRIVATPPVIGQEMLRSVHPTRLMSAERNAAHSRTTPVDTESEPPEFAEYNAIIEARRALAPTNVTALAESYRDEARYWHALAKRETRPHVAMAFRLAERAAALAVSDNPTRKR